jgi:kynurenine formamidase
MQFIDLSQPLYDGCPNCPVHPPVRSRRVADHPADGWRMELFEFASHTGSHLDAPLHKLAGGAAIDQIALERFAGRAVIADLRGLEPRAPIEAEHLSARLGALLEDGIVLLATGWGDKRARTEEWLYASPFLSPPAAQWLVDRKIRGVGIDHYSIGGSAEPANSRTHETLLGAGVWILEDLRFPAEALALRETAMLLALPLHLPGHSGAPCRPVLVVGA